LEKPINLDKGIDHNTPLKDALEFLSDRFDVTILVDISAFPRGANEARIDDTLVGLSARKQRRFDAEPLSEAHLADQWNGRLPARRRGFRTPFLCLDWESMVESLSARLAQIVLPEAGGGAVRLGSLWEKNPAVVVFLRHYG